MRYIERLVDASRFFYKELEEGVLAIGDSNIHHVAASKTGDPVRGYAVSVPAIDYGTISSGLKAA